MRLIEANTLAKLLSLEASNYRSNGDYARAEGISNALWTIAQAKTIYGWISVKDKMPDEGVWVLVWEKQGFAYTDKLVSGIWQIGANNGAIITHWMLMPKGPKEDENVG